MIVDVHAHLGYDRIFEADFPAEELIGNQERYGIDKTIVQPALVQELEWAIRLHDEIARLCERYPGRYYGMANPNPRLPEAEYRREVTRCVRELGFVGVKIHTLAHALRPASAPGRLVLNVARELKIPVMIHTGAGIPWANPSLVEPAATAYPDVKVVMAHSGMKILEAEAFLVAQRCPNVYLETSWTAGRRIREWARVLGAHRVLWGSDHGDNAIVEITKVRTCGLTEEEQAWVLGRTAAEVYGLQQFM